MLEALVHDALVALLDSISDDEINMAVNYVLEDMSTSELQSLARSNPEIFEDEVIFNAATKAVARGLDEALQLAKKLV